MFLPLLLSKLSNKSALTRGVGIWFNRDVLLQARYLEARHPRVGTSQNVSVRFLSRDGTASENVLAATCTWMGPLVPSLRPLRAVLKDTSRHMGSGDFRQLGTPFSVRSPASTLRLKWFPPSSTSLGFSAARCSISSPFEVPVSHLQFVFVPVTCSPLPVPTRKTRSKNLPAQT